MAETSPNKLAAVAVKYAVDTGKMIKSDACQECGATHCEIQAHHHNGYENKLDIIWLCRSCHMEAHDKHFNGNDDGSRKPLIPGLSRKEIAERLGISWRTVERWEQHQKWPKWVDKVLMLPQIRR